MPSAVSGLTNHEAPSAAVVPAGRGWQSVAFRSRYCAYIAPPIIDTVLPSSACAASDELALITVPAPSLPTGIAWSRRAAMNGSACSGTLAVILMAAPLGKSLRNRPERDRPYYCKVSLILTPRVFWAIRGARRARRRARPERRSARHWAP